MACVTPVRLSSSRLGDRQRELNTLVAQAAAAEVLFEHIEALPEHSPVDRLFKIDVAIKRTNVDFLLNNIKDDDMLYVSRALKTKWLVERRDVINPQFLEDTLFPHMVLPAISKMKNWLYRNMREPSMCQQFYDFYKDTEFHFAVKFLPHCDDEYILEQFPHIMAKLSPQQLKLLAEKCPKLLKIYFDSLATDSELLDHYLNDEDRYYNSIKCLLKSDPELVLDISEKYNPLKTSTAFSSLATDYILRNHKSRFMAKSELYVAHMLHMPTVAQRLSSDECQDVLIKMARAEYLSWWFTYDNVEVLVKRISYDKRDAFKQRVFAERDVGELVAEWPYKIPSSPVRKDVNQEEPHVFHDRAYEPIQMMRRFGKRRPLPNRCRPHCRINRHLNSDEEETDGEVDPEVQLQKLIDEFSSIEFKAVLQELSSRLEVRSSHMLLVLVSRCEGHEDNVRALLELALKHRNEPVQERTSIVSSLMKQVSTWRLPQDLWDMLLEYSHGLGLDGTEAEAEFPEGLHAVVLRQLISDGDCQPAVRAAFLEHFSTLTEYELLVPEQEAIAVGLQRLLMVDIEAEQPEVVARHLHQLIDVLETYGIELQSSPVISAVGALVERDMEAARPLLERLCYAGVGHREFLRQFLEFQHDNAALVNALRHDPGALNVTWLVNLLADGETNADQFLLKLAVYYNEPGGFAEQVRQELQRNIEENANLNLVRPLAMLAGTDIQSIWCSQDAAGGDHLQVAAALRADMHRARPAPDALTIGWREAGMKAVAWRAMRCRPAQVTQLAQSLLEERVKRTVRLALALAPRTDCAVDLFKIAVNVRPLAALRAALLYFRRLGDAADLRVWDLVKPLVVNLDLAHRKGLHHVLAKTEWIPKAIKFDYCVNIFQALRNISDSKTESILRDIMPRLAEVNSNLLQDVILRTMEDLDLGIPISYPALVMRYLLLSENEDEEKARWEKVGQPFFDKLKEVCDNDDMRKCIFLQQSLERVMVSLQYNYAFFDSKYQGCLTVIERVLDWMRNFVPQEMDFKGHVNIHAMMLYYKAVRQSIKESPELFADETKRMTEGVEIVGFTFGRYIAQELTELMSKYYESVTELYSESAFGKYLKEYFLRGRSRGEFLAAVARGLLQEGAGGVDTRLAAQMLTWEFPDIEETKQEEINQLIESIDNQETES